MSEGMRVREVRLCLLCGAEGVPRYRGLRDRLFGAPGEWHVRQCPNPACRLLWLDPMPAAEDIGKAYSHYYTHQDERLPRPETWPRRAYRIVKEGYLARRYGYFGASSPAWKRMLGALLYLDPARRAYADFSVMYLPSRPQGRLLDVGCGNGDLLDTLNRMGWSVEGVETDPEAVKRARGRGFPVHLGALEAACYPEDHFDAVTLSHVIEHVHDPARLLEECRRILKRGGRVAVVTPNAESWGHRMFRDSWRGLEPPRHLYVFTLRALRRLVEQAGFRNIKASTTLREADGIFLMSRSIRRSGRYVWGGPQPRGSEIWARLMQMAEWVLMKIDPDAGEEIALVAEK